MRNRSIGIAPALGRWPSLVLAIALIAMSIVMPAARAATSVGDYYDTLNLIWYGNSSGSLPWAPDWTESGDDGSEWFGAFRIGIEPHCVSGLCLVIGKDGGDDASITRQADLSAADTATLSFQRKRHQHAGGGPGLVRVSISTTGTGGWDTLDQWMLDVTDPAAVDEQYDVSSWISATTTIRFELVGGADDSHMNVDNVRIELFEDDNLAPILNPVANATIDEEVPFAFTAAATDPNTGDKLTFELDGAEPSGAAMTTDGDFTWTPTEAQGPGVYAFDVIVRDDGSPSLSDSRTVTLTVEEVNGPPTLDPVGDRTVTEGSLLSFTATGTDPETPADDLTFTLFGSTPPGAAITADGDFTWTPTEAQGPGVYSFDVKVWDDAIPAEYDYETITVTVDEHNLAPSLAAIGDRTVDEGIELTFTAVATDPDLPANELSYALAGGPPGASISNSGAFSWTPTDLQGPGTYTFDVVVLDDGAPVHTDSEPVTVTVNEANIAPTVDPVSPKSVDEGSTLQFTVTATDPDSPANSFVFSLSGAPTGAAITPGGTFTWTPTEIQGPGTYVFDVVATDDGVPAMQGSTAVTVAVAEVNSAPILDFIASQTINEGSPFTVQLTASDADSPANELTYSSTGSPAGLAVSPSGLLTWTPNEGQGPGVHTFDVTVTDDGVPALSDSQTVTFQVNDANNAPIIDPIGSPSGPEEELIAFTATATDPDTPGDSFWFRLSGAIPAGAAMTTAGSFSWIPDESQGPGSYTFDVVVTDTGTPARSSSASVTVTVTEANQPPRLDLLDEYVAEAGLPYLLALVATDPDLPAQGLTFSASGLPDGAELAPSGHLTWQPPESSVGDQHQIRITVTDDGVPALASSASMTLTVTATNLPPVLAPIGDKAAAVGEMLTFVAEATDEDGPDEALVYTLSADAPAGAAIDPATGVFEWRPTNAQDATAHRFTVRVTDAGEFPKSDSETLTVTVGRPNVAPNVASPPNQRSMPRESVTLAVSATDPDAYPEALSFVAINLPPGLEINQLDGTISGQPDFDGLVASPYVVEIVVSDGRDTATVEFLWEIVGVASPLPVTPTRSTLVDRVNEVTSGSAPPVVVRNDISRSFVVMARAVRSGVTELSLPFLLLIAIVGAILVLGRIGLVPALRPGKRHDGVLVRFDSDTGSGLVARTTDGAEVFVHSSAIARRDRKALVVGSNVVFRTVDGSYRDVVTKLRRRRV